MEAVQKAADEAELFFPLDIGGRGSCQIGGNVSTNAGGNRVLRWGMAGDMVIGLEAVLADGSVVSSLTKMLKDNAGYRWKDLLVGSEGTLGIITRAVLRLRPLPRSTQTALVAMSGFDCVPRLLRRLEARFAGRREQPRLGHHGPALARQEVRLGGGCRETQRRPGRTRRTRPAPGPDRRDAVLRRYDGGGGCGGSEHQQANG